jgi:segregation and condensation protein B
MDPERLKPIIEAALLASPQPLTPALLADLFEDGERPPLDAIAQVLHALADDCQGRGVELVEVGSGFRYQVKTDVFPHISALWTERQSRYSRALLETLSLIAYRQPITRGEIEQIRGVAVATSILRTIEEREWVRVVGHRDVPGKPALYGTTRAFLDYFQLHSLDQLPPLSALRDLENLEPELSFEVPAPGQPVAPAADAQAENDADTDPDGDAPGDPDGSGPHALSDADEAATADLDGDRDDDSDRPRA